MTIDEAIEILQTDARLSLGAEDYDLYHAKKLGIEALNRCKEHRYSPYQIEYRPLPGETEE